MVPFQVWLISGAFAPCSITVNVHVKLLKVVDDASSCKAGSDEVGDEELSESLMMSRMPC